MNDGVSEAGMTEFLKQAKHFQSLQALVIRQQHEVKQRVVCSANRKRLQRSMFVLSVA
jgi:hypothetical protein